MHKKFTYIVTLLLLHICSYAQPSMKRSRIAFTAGLNTNDAYDGEFFISLYAASIFGYW